MTFRVGKSACRKSVSTADRSLSLSRSRFSKATGDFQLDISLIGGMWKVQAKVLGVPNLQFPATTALLLVAIGAAVTPILLAIPFIGPFLALAVDASARDRHRWRDRVPRADPHTVFTASRSQSMNSPSFSRSCQQKAPLIQRSILRLT